MKVKPTHLTISIIAAAAHIAKAAPTPNPQNALAGAFYPSFLPSDSGSSTSAASSPVSATFSPSGRKKRRGPFIAQGDGIADNEDSNANGEAEGTSPSSATTAGDNDGDGDGDDSDGEGNTVSITMGTPKTDGGGDVNETGGEDGDGDGDGDGDPDREAEMSSRLDDGADSVRAQIQHALCEAYQQCLVKSNGGASCEVPGLEC